MKESNIDYQNFEQVKILTISNRCMLHDAMTRVNDAA